MEPPTPGYDIYNTQDQTPIVCECGVRYIPRRYCNFSDIMCLDCNLREQIPRAEGSAFSRPEGYEEKYVARMKTAQCIVTCKYCSRSFWTRFVSVINMDLSSYRCIDCVRAMEGTDSAGEPSPASEDMDSGGSKDTLHRPWL